MIKLRSVLLTLMTLFLLGQLVTSTHAKGEVKFDLKKFTAMPFDQPTKLKAKAKIVIPFAPGKYQQYLYAKLAKKLKPLNKVIKKLKKYRFQKPGRGPASLTGKNGKYHSPRYLRGMARNEFEDADYKQYQKFLVNHQPL
jgi:hypothetical protein